MRRLRIASRPSSTRERKKESRSPPPPPSTKRSSSSLARSPFSRRWPLARSLAQARAIYPPPPLARTPTTTPTPTTPLSPRARRRSSPLSTIRTLPSPPPPTILSFSLSLARAYRGDRRRPRRRRFPSVLFRAVPRESGGESVRRRRRKRPLSLPILTPSRAPPHTHAHAVILEVVVHFLCSARRRTFPPRTFFRLRRTRRRRVASWPRPATSSASERGKISSCAQSTTRKDGKKERKSLF